MLNLHDRFQIRIEAHSSARRTTGGKRDLEKRMRRIEPDDAMDARRSIMLCAIWFNRMQKSLPPLRARSRVVNAHIAMVVDGAGSDNRIQMYGEKSRARTRAMGLMVIPISPWNRGENSYINKQSCSAVQSQGRGGCKNLRCSAVRLSIIYEFSARTASPRDRARMAAP